MTVQVRLLLLLQAAAFAAAALLHRGVLAAGYEHWRAATAETVIAVVLTGAALLTWVAAGRTRRIALLAQGFALLGTAVGLFTIAIGVGPQSAVDLAIHAVFVTALVAGLVFVARWRVPA